MRESAFNLIADWAGTVGELTETMLDRFSFLDLFCGSGAVALEAASRGAGPVVAVEKDAPTAAVARRNASETGLDVRVVTSTVEQYLAGPPTAFDIVWMDPPYPVPTSTIDRLLSTLVAGPWVAPDGLIIIERSTRDTPPTWPESLAERWFRRYGETTLYLATTETP